MSTELIVAMAAAILTSIIGPIAVNYVNEKYLKKNSKEDTLKEAIDLNNLIIPKLEEIKETHKVSRIWLCQFHNGGYFYPTGKSMQKFSMIYEISDSGVAAQQTLFQSIPIGLFNKSMNKLAEGENIIIPNYKKFENYGLESFADNSNTKSTYLFPLITIDNKFIGIVGLDYISETYLEANDINSIGLEVSTIGGVLMSEYLTKK